MKPKWCAKAAIYFLEERNVRVKSILLFFVFVIVVLVSKATLAEDQNPTKRSQTMPTEQPLLDEKLLEYAKETIRLYGDQIPPEAQKSILEQKVILGMSPYEARLAGGAFFYKVVADPKNWPPNADPLNVMWKQSTNPDNSKIWMTFENATQFPGEGTKRFMVYFIKGKAVEITKNEEKK